ncbi:DUF1102 domain-containing protein [Halorubrum terrestre]|uniref:DUF1102 domain-containing protein n=1 Tax=Halorubrum distributum TaxID=29283 RepID=A0A6B1IT73_9EURY|nr:DUF1102 domain-containing protein [Halorubrum terrestre]MYL18145.1 DUF1102 domain-containing protein [Halorubrum terrestre]
MERRKFVVGLGALASGSAAAMGTGAFTSVEADRNVDVNVSDDAAAYLRLQGSGGNNSEYVTQDGDGNQLAINLTDSNNNFPSSTDPNGVNPDAVTQLDNLFVIQNQGTQEVSVDISKSGGNTSVVGFYANTSESPTGRYNPSNGNTVRLGSGSITLTTGETVYVSIEIDTEDSGVSSGTQVLNSVTVNADAT